MFGLGYLIACAFGWMLYASVTGVAHADAPVLSGALSAPVAADPYEPAAVSSASAVGPPASPRTVSLSSSTNPTGATYPEALEGSATSTAATGATYVPPAADQPAPDLAPAQISPQAPELPMSTVSPLSLVDDASFGGSVYDPATTLPAVVTNPLAILEADQAPAVGPDWIRGPGSYIAPILAPLPGAQTRAVAFAEWESYRTEVVGRNILAATDDSNLFMYRDGKLNGNTGDTDASGLNVTDARNSVIRGTTSADFPPWENQSGTTDSDDEDEEDDSSDETDTGDVGDTETGDDLTTNLTTTRVASAAPVAAAFAAVTEASAEYPFDFPYVEWVKQISGDRASAVHTDEGTTLASGQDVVVVGADGYDDDDNRAVGEHLVLTRDDCNVVVGGTGPVNAQIGDSEQGAVIMDVDNVLIEGGGAF